MQYFTGLSALSTTMSTITNAHSDGCGLYFVNSGGETPSLFRPQQTRRYLPLTSLSVHGTILSTVSQTHLTQIFFNPSPGPISASYRFPLYDGVSVVGFTCTINNKRVIRGSVQEKQKAREIFNNTIARGETAGLLEQLPGASDVFTTTVGNVPAGAEIKVGIVVLGELKHDAEVDGVKYTLPTLVAPRYGGPAVGGIEHKSLQMISCRGLSITVDVEMQSGSVVTSLISPSHPIAIRIGSSSSRQASANVDKEKPTLASLSPQTDATVHQPQLASATLSLGNTFLDKDFVLQIIATKISEPVAILETHPTMPDQRALMTTLVPKFNLPSERPEIVFVCDQSGSMQGQKITNLRFALQLFLKSLPVGVKFNICSFGSHHSFLFPEGSRTYDAANLDAAMQTVCSMQSDYGGTEIYAPIEATFDKRDASLDLDVFVLTDGQVWNQDRIFDMINVRQEEAKGSIRLFTLGIGDGASSALIEGLSRAGNGFTQTVSDSEKLDRKIIRMLKAALTPHVSDYTLEIQYRKTDLPIFDKEDGDDFEFVADIDLTESSTSSNDETASDPSPKQKKPISLYDSSVKPDDILEPSSDLPDIPIPKILQVPFQIPPLFPFNRTSIFMLLSPETAGQEPESITLRATSRHGPLILDIPVTTPIDPTGEVIHQLAARKAALELEEGRGWIFHAKHESVPLKEAYPREFHNIVEREAVRLGVKFQVGGKWCSFVAIDERGKVLNTSSALDKQASMPDICLNAPPGAQNATAGNGPRLFGSVSSFVPNATASRSMSNVFGAASGSTSVAPDRGPRASLFGQPMSSGSVSSRQSSSQTHPFGSGSFFIGSMASNSTGTMGGGMGSGLSPSTPSQVRGVFGANPSIKASYGMSGGIGGMGGGMPPGGRTEVPGLFGTQAMSKPHVSLFGQQAVHVGGDAHKRLRKARMCFKKADTDAIRVDALNAVPSLIGQRRSSSAQESPLETIVRLQHFVGFWTWSDEIFYAIGMDQEHLVTNEINISPDAWATIAVLAFMSRKLADEKDVWELLEEKALAWLFTQMSSDEHDKLGEMIDTAGQQLR